MITHKGSTLLTAVTGVLVLLSLSAAAQTWSATASTCQVDDGYPIVFDVSGGTLSFAGGNSGTIHARCNVTNPVDTGKPTWIGLRVGYRDPDGVNSSTRVYATLYQVDRSTGNLTALTSFDSNSYTDSGATQHTKLFFGIAFDFSKYAYYIDVSLTRSAGFTTPQVWSLRLD